MNFRHCLPTRRRHLHAVVIPSDKCWCLPEWQNNQLEICIDKHLTMECNLWTAHNSRYMCVCMYIYMYCILSLNHSGADVCLKSTKFHAGLQSAVISVRVFPKLRTYNILILHDITCVSWHFSAYLRRCQNHILEHVLEVSPAVFRAVDWNLNKPQDFGRTPK